ncbi:hypothetical protein L2E82_01529 [Cichorium intybus]|uniref:Uncharacterized protein n=1 Tax=Cichorium intybus TaxID=13427 RepID=A0ACB9H088_CICIN|nr:hypothetical protein L2E82_01529 [Cichorium intybus]
MEMTIRTSQRSIDSYFLDDQFQLDLNKKKKNSLAHKLDSNSGAPPEYVSRRKIFSLRLYQAYQAVKCLSTYPTQGKGNYVMLVLPRSKAIKIQDLMRLEFPKEVIFDCLLHSNNKVELQVPQVDLFMEGVNFV